MNALRCRMRLLGAGLLRCPVHRLVAGLLLPLASLAAPAAGAGSTSAGQVVLLHGLGRSEWAMSALERRLVVEGYTVHNLGYPSRDAELGALATGLADEIERCCSQAEPPLHFVTHSMGGIVLRTLLDGQERPQNLGRVVMLAPPNHGSEWVDELRGLALFRLAGPAAAQLGTDPGSLPRSLGPVDYELGVLAGNRSFNPLGSWLIPGEDDGTVGVDSARIEGMSDFRVVPSTHTWILHSPRALAEVSHFLAHGAFLPPSD